MTNKEALSILQDRVMQNIFEMSSDYMMTRPKAGVSREDWETEKELADILRDLLREE